VNHTNYSYRLLSTIPVAALYLKIFKIRIHNKKNVKMNENKHFGVGR